MVSGWTHAEERLRLAEELTGGTRAGVGWLISPGLIFSGFAFLGAGKRDRAEEVWKELNSFAERTKQPASIINSLQADGHRAIRDGRLEEAVEIFHLVLSRGREVGLQTFAGLVALVGLGRPLLHLGRAEECRELVKSIQPYPWLLAVCSAYLGSEKEATELLEQFTTACAVKSLTDEMQPWMALGFLEAAALVKHKRMAELLLEGLGLSTLKDTGIYWPTCPARHFGAAAALLGRYDEARKYYQEAIKVCTEMPFRPELALSRLQLAELLLEHYPAEKKEALEHLDFAIKEFREMKMQPSLERALRHKDILKA